MAKPLLGIFPQYFDDDGDPLAGGKIHTYIAGTSVRLATYNSPDGSIPNTNPVILDGAGRTKIFFGARRYKLILTDSEDNVIDTQDDVDGTDAEVNSTPAWAEHEIEDGQVATELGGETIDLEVHEQANYDVVVRRGTAVVATGTVDIQDVDGTGRAVPGLFRGYEGDLGLTWSVVQDGTTCTLAVAVEAGLGAGVIKLARRLVPA